MALPRSSRHEPGLGRGGDYRRARCLGLRSLQEPGPRLFRPEDGGRGSLVPVLPGRPALHLGTETEVLNETKNGKGCGNGGPHGDRNRRAREHEQSRRTEEEEWQEWARGKRGYTPA